MYAESVEFRLNSLRAVARAADVFVIVAAVIYLFQITTFWNACFCLLALAARIERKNAREPIEMMPCTHTARHGTGAHVNVVHVRWPPIHST